MQRRTFPKIKHFTEYNIRKNRVQTTIEDSVNARIFRQYVNLST